MASKARKEFQINIYSLTNKLHEFDFDIDSRLFEDREYSLITKGDGKCHLDLTKSETMMTLKFHIECQVELTCDRSLELFMHPLVFDDQLIIKFGDSDYTLSEDVIVIRKETDSINVADYIYEFIGLRIPMKKIHPDYLDEDEEDDDDELSLIYATPEDKDESSDDDKDDNDEIDPRWAALKKLKD